jgi:cephalosporin-C deacetylase
MALAGDLNEAELRAYRPRRVEPADFDGFWAATLAEVAAHPLAAEFTPLDTGLSTVEVSDVTFAGFGGEPVRGWFLTPRGAGHGTGDAGLGCVVEFIGYGGGRGLPHERLLWASAGYANLIMDTRGQGSTWSAGATPDSVAAGPHAPGFLTRGIESPATYYYRRVFTDAVRAVQAARSHPAVDPERVVVTGVSQGGGIALAAAALVPDVRAVMADVPFLCHIRRAVELTDAAPYQELTTYCSVHRDKIEAAFTTLSYFDCVNFAPRTLVPALFSVALMDETCPPPTVFAAYNHYAGEKEIRVWPFNGHEGGMGFQTQAQLGFLAQRIRNKLARHPRGKLAIACSLPLLAKLRPPGQLRQANGATG